MKRIQNPEPKIQNRYKIGVISLGCPKNTVDTECIIKELGNPEITRDPSDADAIIINTCAFLKQSRKESESAVKAMLKTGKKVIVAGCYVSKDIKGLRKKYPGVHAWVGVNDISSVKKALAGGGIFNSSAPCVYTYKQHTTLINPYSAYVKLSEGCNHRCAFCIIPFIKGRYRSRSTGDIVKEIKVLVNSGVKEINLISQDLAYYGTDCYGVKKLPALVRSVLKAVKKDFMLRLLYLYPDIKVIKPLVSIMKKDRRLCRYLDIPLQHVNSRMLKIMKRGYAKKDTEELINFLRSEVPGITIRSSFITGFPGETKKEFLELLEFIKEGKIDRPGVFAYSDEPDSAAFCLKNKVERAVIKERHRRLALASERVCYYNNRKKPGTVIKVMVTGQVKPGIYAARGEENAPDVDGYIFINTKKKLSPGRFVNVKITRAYGPDMEAGLKLKN